MLEQLKAAGAIASASALVVIALFSSSTAVFADNNNGNEGQLQPLFGVKSPAKAGKPSFRPMATAKMAPSL